MLALKGPAVQRGAMADASPLLTPDLARCRILRVGVRAPIWGWNDLAGDSEPSLLGHPTLPFETDDSELPQPVGDDVPAEIRRMSAALSRVIAEVLAGRRSATQLSPWTTRSSRCWLMPAALTVEHRRRSHRSGSSSPSKGRTR